MNLNPRVMPFVTLLTTIVAAVAMIQCSSDPSTTPTTPTNPTPALSGVTLNPPSVAVGGTGQGTVTLTVAAPAAGASIALSSSNTAVATVPTPVVIAAGSSSATFTVTAVSAGTTTITASLSGSGSQTATFTVTARPVALASISLSAASVVGGDTITGVATLTGAAPAGGAAVSLSATDPASVPASVTVPAGATSATFNVSTRMVGGGIASTITGSYGGTSSSVMLSITKPIVATASFGVTGPTETETCTLANGGNTLNCIFDGTTSTAPGTIVSYEWLWAVATTFAQTTSGPILRNPTINCGLIPPPPLPPGNPWFTLTVTLRVRDDLGNVSAEQIDRGARLLPQGFCGF